MHDTQGVIPRYLRQGFLPRYPLPYTTIPKALYHDTNGLIPRYPSPYDTITKALYHDTQGLIPRYPIKDLCHDTMVQWHLNTMIRWHSNTLRLWYSDTVTLYHFSTYRDTIFITRPVSSMRWRISTSRARPWGADELVKQGRSAPAMYTKVMLDETKGSRQWSVIKGDHFNTNVII